MTTCKQCGREVYPATLPSGERVTLDAEPHRDGQYAAWSTRSGAAWTWRAQHHTAGDRFDDVRLRRIHACTARDVQLDISAA